MSSESYHEPIALLSEETKDLHRAIGYADHDRTKVELYLTESFTFRVLEDKAAILLRRPTG